ncbi:MAG: hypothetical protein ABF689_09725, partial [Gluconobacter cerinus]|uniref:hypothetical protein n=1 Tax=Gluconobacter cerinus TaxID=38307 RepID=UPI0039EC4555
MTSRTALRMLLLSMLTGAVSAYPAQAARVTMSGSDLDMAIPCTGQVRIVVDPGMKDGATLDSSNATQVTMRSGKEESDSRISIATKSCAPNGKVTISVSPYTGVSIHDSHDTHFIIKGKLASLDASLDSATMDIENTQSLDLSMHGASSVHIGSLERAAQIVASGTSTLIADSAQLTALSAQLSNDASFMVSQGSIEALTIVTSDNATATVHGNASVATVTANGTGAVNIERVSGPIVRSGSGAVNVGTPAAVAPPPTVVTPAAPPVTATLPVAPPPVPKASVPAPQPPASTETSPQISQPSVPAPSTSAPPTPVPQKPAQQEQEAVQPPVVAGGAGGGGGGGGGAAGGGRAGGEGGGG